MNQPIGNRAAKWAVLLGLSALSFGYAAPAHAIFHISVFGVGYSPEPSETLDGTVYSSSGSFKMGLGGQLGLGLLPMTELEIGALYYSRNATNSATVNSVFITQSIAEPIFEVPVDLRVQLGMFYVRGGVYASIATGEVSYSGSSGSGSESVSDASFTPWDYGALIGAGIDIPIAPALAVTAGVQYQQQISNSSSTAKTGLFPNDSAKFNSLLFTAGFRLGY